MTRGKSHKTKTACHTQHKAACPTEGCGSEGALFTRNFNSRRAPQTGCCWPHRLPAVAASQSLGAGEDRTMTVMTTGKDGQDSNGAEMPSAVSSVQVFWSVVRTEVPACGRPVASSERWTRLAEAGLLKLHTEEQREERRALCQPPGDLRGVHCEDTSPPAQQPRLQR